MQSARKRTLTARWRWRTMTPMTPPAATATHEDWTRAAAELHPLAGAAWRAYAAALHERLLDRWVGELAPGARVLKTDCFDEALGTPHPAAAIAARAWRPVAVDVGLTIAAGAARNGGAGIAVADVRRLPYPDGAIDAVFSNSTLDHFADAGEIGKALAEIRRVLRPGGRLLLTLDNPRHPLVALRNALPRRATEAAGITHFYVGATLAMSAARRLLARLGFEPRGAGYLMHAPRWWSIRRLARVERDKPERIPFLIKRLLAAERAARWPSAPLTGHFLWIDAAIPDRRRR